MPQPGSRQRRNVRVPRRKCMTRIPGLAPSATGGSFEGAEFGRRQFFRFCLRPGKRSSAHSCQNAAATANSPNMAQPMMPVSRSGGPPTNPTTNGNGAGIVVSPARDDARSVDAPASSLNLPGSIGIIHCSPSRRWGQWRGRVFDGVRRSFASGDARLGCRVGQGYRSGPERPF
jgi:hypothetical protein